jgi:hypothetical protein
MSLAQSIRLLRERPRVIIGTTMANWNSGVATSGAAGADLVTIGVAGQWYRLNQFTLVLTGFNAAATITIRSYMNVAGANRLVIDDDYTPPLPDTAFLSWWFDAEFFGPFRVEVHSDQAADDGFNATYEYRIKNW